VHTLLLVRNTFLDFKRWPELLFATYLKRLARHDSNWQRLFHEISRVFFHSSFQHLFFKISYFVLLKMIEFSLIQLVCLARYTILLKNKHSASYEMPN
jgi:hypothetical protein